MIKPFCSSRFKMYDMPSVYSTSSTIMWFTVFSYLLSTFSNGNVLSLFLKLLSD